MGIVYHGVVSGVRNKIGPSGLIMTHFNLKSPDGTIRHVIAMREGRRPCRGAEVVRDGIRAEISGEWAVGNKGRNTNPAFFAHRVVLMKAALIEPDSSLGPIPGTDDVSPAPPVEDMWWDWDTIKDAS
jgi:hypothetical protein